MKRILCSLVLAVLAACNADRVTTPGGTIQFDAAGPVTVTWSADGGTISGTGAWTAPACGAAMFPHTYTIQATSSLGAQIFTVRIEEAITRVDVLGAVITGETVLSPSPVTLTPGQSAQFYARLTYSCHVEYSPSAPPGF